MKDVERFAVRMLILLSLMAIGWTVCYVGLSLIGCL